MGKFCKNVLIEVFTSVYRPKMVILNLSLLYSGIQMPPFTPLKHNYCAGQVPSKPSVKSDPVVSLGSISSCDFKHCNKYTRFS